MQFLYTEFLTKVNDFYILLLFVSLSFAFVFFMFKICHRLNVEYSIACLRHFKSIDRHLNTVWHITPSKLEYWMVELGLLAQL